MTKELKKLETYLKEHGIRYQLHSVCGDEIDQIVVPSRREDEREWDAICHQYSFGGKQGFLEIMGTLLTREEEDGDGDGVVGWLTAEDVIERIEKKAVE